MAVKTEKGSEVKDFTADPQDSDKILGYTTKEGTRWWSLSRFWNWLWSKIKSNTKSTLDTSDPTAPVNTSAVNVLN